MVSGEEGERKVVRTKRVGGKKGKGK